MKKLIKKIVVIALCLSILSSITAAAVTPSYAPYQGYEYNTYDESVAAPIGYLQNEVIEAGDFSYDVDIKSFTDSAADINESPSIYVLDGKAGVVYKTDLSVNIKGVYSDFKNTKGKKVSLKGADLIACDNASAYFFVYKDGNIFVINALSEVVKTIKLNNVVTMTTYIVENTDADGNTVYDNYILAVTSNNKNGVHVYSQTGKKIGFFKLGKDIKDIVQTAGTVYAVDGGTNEILYLEVETKTKGDKEVFKKISAYDDGTKQKISADLSKATSITPDAFGEYYFVSLSNGKIARIGSDLTTNNVKYIDNSVLPKNVDVPSMKFGSIVYDVEKDRVVSFSNSGDANYVVFNNKNGYVRQSDKLDISLSAPSDMYYSESGYLYVLDSGNSRILKIDKDLKTVVDIFSNFYNKKLGYLTFVGAEGFTVDEDENIFIADTQNERVFISDKNGNVKTVITRPDEQLVDTELPFSARKVLVDRKGLVYVLCDGINLGAFVFNMDGEFVTFYGSNNVTATSEVILNYFRKKFMTREQMQGLTQITPISITNFDIDDNGFVYTVTKTDQEKTLTADAYKEMVRKLNYQGDNIFELSGNSKGFGDFEWDRQKLVLNTAFNDLDVDDQSFVNLVDISRGKVFQYSEDGDLVTVFGAFSNQSGTFEEPSAIESIGNKICVLDKSLNAIIVFTPTDYTLALREAYQLLDSSDADRALAAWSKVLKFNTNSQHPYYGMGRAYEMKGDYENAMKYFKLANAKPEYSKAFEEYRTTYISENVWWMVLILIAVAILVFVAFKFLKKKTAAKEGEAFTALESKWGLPLYVLLHPVDGFEQFRTRNIHNIPVAIGMFIAGFLIKVLEFFGTGFIFNSHRPIDYDMFATMIGSIAVYALFVISNWAICTLLNGKGRMKDILCVTGYALTPMLFTQIICVILSNTMTLEEQAFITIISVIGMLWSAIILIMGMYTIHQYSFIGTIGSIILTVLGIAVMALLIMLFYTLLSQFVSFIISVSQEISLR